MRSARALVVLAALAALAGCGGGQRAFSHQFADNQAEDLAAVLERLPDARPNSAPGNALGEHLVVATTHGEAGARRVVALTPSGEERWSQTIDAETRPEILGDIVLVSERHQLVALDVRTGARRWTVPLADLAYVGAARDGDTIYFSATVGALGGARRVGHVTAVDALTGEERWRHEVQGVFGQPAAVGGMVMVPWERQNLAILDELTGHELARLRATDDVLAWAFDDPTGVYYGHRSVYRMTHRSVSGTRAESSHRALPIPQLPVLREGEVAREVEVWDDGFLPKPGTRSARGRIRLYFAPDVTTGDDVAIVGDTIYFVYYRYVFGYDLEGNLRWARILEQDVIGARATEQGLFVVGEQGQMRVLDRENGTDRWIGGSELQLASVALDVAGFAAGSPSGSAPTLRESLAAIAVDPDNRLVTARAYAVQQLAAMEDPEITRDLLDLYAQQSMPGALRQAIGDALRIRRTGGEHLVEALGHRYDYLEDTASPPLEVIVPSLLEMRATQAVPGLVQQMNDHETPAAVLPTVVRAVVELGDASVVPALRQFLTIYHADSAFAESPEALAIAAEGVFRHGGPEEREALTAMAAETRTLEGLRSAITGYFEAERQQQEALARREAEEAQRALEEAARQAEAALPTRLSQEQINQTFAEHADPLRECVAAELGRNPILGQVRLVFILSGDGRATDIGVAPNSPELVQCMQERVAAITFPRFRQRLMRAQFVIRVRGGGEDDGAQSEETLAATPVPPDAPWWTWWQRRAGASEQVASGGRAWWDRRPAPVQPAAVPTGPAVPTVPVSGGAATSTASGAAHAGSGGGAAWWSAAGDDAGEEAEETVEEPSPQPAPPPPPAETRRGARGRRGAAQQPEAAAPQQPAQPEPPAAAPPQQPTPPQQPQQPAQPPAPPPPEETPWWAPAEG